MDGALAYPPGVLLTVMPFILLWLLGLPLGIIVLLFLFGVGHRVTPVTTDFEL